MKKLINDNYQSMLSRALITNKTQVSDFVDKIFEEAMEVSNECTETIINDYDFPKVEKLSIDKIDKSKLAFELADVILVALNFAKHYDIDIEKYLKEKVNINFKRANKHKLQ